MTTSKTRELIDLAVRDVLAATNDKGLFDAAKWICELSRGLNFTVSRDFVLDITLTNKISEELTDAAHAIEEGMLRIELTADNQKFVKAFAANTLARAQDIRGYGTPLDGANKFDVAAMVVK